MNEAAGRPAYRSNAQRRILDNAPWPLRVYAGDTRSPRTSAAAGENCWQQEWVTRRHDLRTATFTNSALLDCSFNCRQIQLAVRPVNAGEMTGRELSGHPIYGLGATVRRRGSACRARELDQCRTTA